MVINLSFDAAAAASSMPVRKCVVRQFVLLSLSTIRDPYSAITQPYFSISQPYLQKMFPYWAGQIASRLSSELEVSRFVVVCFILSCFYLFIQK